MFLCKPGLHGVKQLKDFFFFLIKLKLGPVVPTKLSPGLSLVVFS